VEENALKITLTDGFVEIGSRTVIRFPDTEEHMIPLTTREERESAALHPSHMQLCRISAAKQDQRGRIERCEQALAVDAAYQMLTGDFQGLNDAAWRERLGELERERERMHRLETEPYRRWASGFSCLAFVIVGIPLAIRLRNADIMTTFGICFLPILGFYYPLFAVCLDRAKLGALPPYSMWLGNLVCLAVGAWQLRKVLRY